MTNIIQFPKKPIIRPHEQAASDTVEQMRQVMYTFSSDKQRMEYCLVIIAQLVLWVVRSRYYDSPKNVVLTWVTKKLDQYTKESSNGADNSSTR